MTAIALLPWVAFRQTRTVGNVCLIPYRRGRSPGDQPHVSQATLDKILASYAENNGAPLADATLVEVDGHPMGTDLESCLDQLFLAEAAIGFAALSERRLFHGNLSYVCFDNFKLVVQRFSQDAPGSVAFSTRRRDGATTTGWGAGRAPFVRPLHVHRSVDPPIDIVLAGVLLRRGLRELANAVNEFNRANTDSSDVPIHVELVMMKSAFEWLLGVGAD